MLGTVLGIVAMFILVGLAAFLASSETALMRVSRIRVRYLAEKKVKKADKLESLIEDPDKFLPPLLLMVLAVQLTAASIATWVTTEITGSAGIGVAVGTAVITAFMFVFGELVPKAAASHNSERVALRVTGPVSFISKTLRPLSLLFEKIATKPGMPTIFGVAGKTFCFGLPGNPVSTFVLFELLVKPFLYAMMGHNFQPPVVSLRLARDVTRKNIDRDSWIPVRKVGHTDVEPVEYHGSGHLTALPWADGLICIPRGVARAALGDMVDVRQI